MRCYFSVWETRPGAPHLQSSLITKSEVKKSCSREVSLPRELTPEKMNILAAEALEASHQRGINYMILWTIPDRILLIHRMMPRDPASFDPIVDTLPLPNPIPIKVLSTQALIAKLKAIQVCQAAASMTDSKKWRRRLPVRIYDYNCKLSESYYAPQTEFISSRSASREREVPPESATYGERFASRPFYGSARGLPYDESRSALTEPLVNRRAVSESRARTRYNYEDDDIPDPNVRQSRSRRRKMILKIENDEEPEVLKPVRRRPPVSVDDDLEIHVKPLPKFNIDEELKKIEDELSRTRKSSVQFEHTVRDDDLTSPPPRRRSIKLESPPPRRRSVKQENISFSLPTSTKDVDLTSPPPRRRSLKQEHISFSQPTSTTRSSVRSTYTSATSKFESSKPPLPPRSRNISIGESDFRTTSPLRSELINLLDSDEFKSATPRRRPRLKSFGDIEETAVRPSAKMLRDSRRAQESEELSQNISKMLQRMHETSLTAKADSVASHKYTRDIGATANDPFESQTRRRSRQQARAHNFVYGIRY